MENKHLSDNELKPRKWLLYVLIIINIVIIIVIANKIITDRQNKDDDKNSIFDKINNALDNNDYVSEIDKMSFNSSFEMYVGTKWGLQVSRLIDEVTTNNKTNSEHIITVVYGDINSTDSNEIRNIKKELDDWTDYEVILDYDDNGFVYLITIEE